MIFLISYVITCSVVVSLYIYCVALEWRLAFTSLYEVHAMAIVEGRPPPQQPTGWVGHGVDLEGVATCLT